MLNQRQFKQAVQLHEQGRHDEAEALYAKLQKSDPKNAHIVHFRALLAGHKGNEADSIALLQQAIRLNPNIPDFYRNLADRFEKLGDKRQAAIAYAGLGGALAQQTKFEEAVQAYDKSLTLTPGEKLVLANRTAAQQHVRGVGGSDTDHRAAVFRLKHKAKTVPDLLALASAYQRLEEDDKALPVLDRVLAMDPNCGPAHLNAAFVHLMRGDLEKGWKEHEWRWAENTGYIEFPRCGFSQPVWKGETPEQLGGALLVVMEQAYGDAIQFSRYVRLLADRGHKVLFEVQPYIVSLFAEALKHPNIRVIPRGYYRWDKWHLGWLAKRLGHPMQKASATEIYRDLPFKAWVGLLSLPERFGTTLETIPAATPYLFPAPARIARWARTLAQPAGTVKIGLVWSGDVRHAEDYKRSMSFSQIAPLLDRANVQFYSLQVGAPAAQIEPRGNLTNVALDLTDFTETAAAIQNLDLVISVDTSVAHLAGALNKPVWIVMPPAKDWRWLKNRSDSPWYPSARLFRQHKSGEWEGVVADVGAALDELAVL